MTDAIFFEFGGGSGLFGGDGLTVPAGQIGPTPVLFLNPASKTPSSPLFFGAPLYTVLQDTITDIVVIPPLQEVRGGPDESKQKAVRSRQASKDRRAPKHYFQKSFEQLAYEAQLALDEAAAIAESPILETVNELDIDDSAEASSARYKSAKDLADRLVGIADGLSGLPAMQGLDQLLSDVRATEVAVRTRALREHSVSAALAAATLLWYN